MLTSGINRFVNQGGGIERGNSLYHIVGHTAKFGRFDIDEVTNECLRFLEITTIQEIRIIDDCAYAFQCFKVAQVIQATSEEAGKLHQLCRGDGINTAFVFLYLLGRNTKHLSQLLLGESERPAQLENFIPYGLIDQLVTHIVPYPALPPW